ncbi:MAG TPA: hypothetical protein VJP60_08475 [Rhizomicrobium sp.]|nr:hypothetical protein [Rhizomicrobium sp.]
MRWNGIWVLMFLLPAPVAQAADDIVVSPLKSSGEIVHYPRLTRFPDAQIQKRVNDLLATRDKEESVSHAWCETNLREAHQKKDKDFYFTSIEVTHISRRFLSFAITGEYYCGGAHPDHGPREPLTIDLSSGKAVDWDKEFRPGFLGENGRLATIYHKRYPALRGNDPKDDCIEDIRADPLSSFYINLVSKEGGLAVKPEQPFATIACMEPLALRADELAPYIRDANLMAELQTMAARK